MICLQSDNESEMPLVKETWCAKKKKPTKIWIGNKKEDRGPGVLIHPLYSIDVLNVYPKHRKSNS